MASRHNTRKIKYLYRNNDHAGLVEIVEIVEIASHDNDFESKAGCTSLSNRAYVFIYVYMYVCINVCMYVCCMY